MLTACGESERSTLWWERLEVWDCLAQQAGQCNVNRWLLLLWEELVLMLPHPVHHGGLSLVLSGLFCDGGRSAQGTSAGSLPAHTKTNTARVKKHDGRA